VVGDLFCSPATEGGFNLREAIKRIEEEGRGVLLYLEPARTLAEEFESVAQPSGPRAATDVPAPADSVPLQAEPNLRSSARAQLILRKFGLGAQMLADLGVHQLRLLTNSQRKIAGLTGYGLEIVERVSLRRNDDNPGEGND
jgi:3,4-dihydroxy 2-butanone 4-phosphate synthase/GTP cyclohydrolase II